MAHLVDLNRRLGRLVVLCVILVLAVVFGGGGYYASQLTAVEEPLSWRPVITVADLAGTDDPDLRLGVTGLVLEADETTVVAVGIDTPSPICTVSECTLATARSPMLAGLGPDARLLVDPNIWTEPAQAGLDADEVVVSGPLGDLPAWFIDGEGDHWVIIVHGRANTRAEGIRAATTVDVPRLLVSYRNDGDAPDAEDGRARFGTEEWEDLDAAVTWALANGAEDIVLWGYSQGGAVIGSWLARSSSVDKVAGLVFDSPLLGMHETLVQQAKNRGIPGPLIAPLLFGAKTVARISADLDLGEVEHLDRLGSWPDVPILAFHGSGDESVPVRVTQRLKDALPERVTWEHFGDVGHVRSFNADPERYRATVDAWFPAQRDVR